VSVAAYGFREDLVPIRRLAARLRLQVGVIDVHRFPDGETLPTAPADASSTVILYRSLHHPNERLVELLLAADACRRAGAGRLVLVAPYLCYLRQDAVFEKGQSLSRDVVGGWLGRAFDRIVTVQAHVHRTAQLSDVFGVPCDNLSVAGALASLAAAGERLLVVGPDAESAPWAAAAAAQIGGEATTFRKRRLGDRQVELTLPSDTRFDGRAVLLLDDVCSSGGTLQRAILQLRQAGAKSIDVAVAHALFDAETERRLVCAGARRIISSDSVPHPTNALALDDVLASALKDEVC